MADLKTTGKLMDHAYDEIQEYDNPLPGWWTWLFNLTIGFSILYIAYFMMGSGPSIFDQYEAEKVAHTEKLLAQLGEIRGDNNTIVSFMNKSDWMSAIQSVYVSNCAQCHGNYGEGDIGPNLTDDFYKSVNEPADLYNSIMNGVAGTAMPAWGERLGEPQVILLSAYVASLRGTSPEGEKGAEGTEAPPWPAVEPALEQPPS